MTEETAVRIAETLEGIKDAMWLIGGLAIIIFGAALFVYILTKNW